MACIIHTRIRYKNYSGKIFRINISYNNVVSSSVISISSNEGTIFVDIINTCDVRFDVGLIYFHVVTITAITVHIFVRNFYCWSTQIGSNGNFCFAVGIV